MATKKKSVAPSPVKKSSLISKAEELQAVKNKIESTSAKLARLANEGSETQFYLDELIQDHKKLQADLTSEALLIKPE